MTQGPAEKLNDTTYSQPALFVAGLAAVEKLRAENSDAIDNCSAAAGLSLGEYTALVFAEVLSFEDALKIVKVNKLIADSLIPCPIVTLDVAIVLRIDCSY
jgi:[acyl-carrier-protein] S-malonyltransferase